MPLVAGPPDDAGRWMNRRKMGDIACQPGIGLTAGPSDDGFSEVGTLLDLAKGPGYRSSAEVVGFPTTIRLLIVHAGWIALSEMIIDAPSLTSPAAHSWPPVAVGEKGRRKADLGDFDAATLGDDLVSPVPLIVAAGVRTTWKTMLPGIRVPLSTLCCRRSPAPIISSWPIF
ncbi:hypothetical protein ACLOJK_036652 [Asimina triloba]